MADVVLDIEGMTCAACAARIEKNLNKLEGVAASVNLATDKASIHFPETMPVETLLERIRDTGYSADTTPLNAAVKDYVRNYLVPRRHLGDQEF